RVTSSVHASRNSEQAMSFSRKATILAILILSATLPPASGAFSSATDGNRSVEEFGELHVGNQTEPRGEDTVYLEIHGVARRPGRPWLRRRPQTSISSPDPERTQHSGLHEPALLQVKEFSSLQPDNTTSPSNQSLDQQQGVLDAGAGFQSDFPGMIPSGKERVMETAVPSKSTSRLIRPEELGILDGGPPTFVTQEWLEMRPLVHCSGDAMTLTAAGRGYTHFLVDRADATPVSLLHLSPNCSDSLKTTWRHMVLRAPFDGCYVLQENGSYVLPLLWWGMPVKISCPMSSASAQGTPSGFCSDFGMAIKMEGARGAVEDYKVQVNGKWHPLVSETCACRVDSLSGDLVFFIPFTAPCASDENTLNVLLNGKEFTLSCPMPLAYYPELFHPLHLGQKETYFTPDGPDPSSSPPLMKRETTGPHVAPYQAPYQNGYMPHPPLGFYPVKYPNPYLMGPDLSFEMPIMPQQYGYIDPMLPFPQAAPPPVGAPGASIYQYPSMPLYLEPGMHGPATKSPKATIPPVPSSVGQQHPLVPMMYHPYNHVLHPMHFYPKPAYQPHTQSKPVLPSPVPSVKFTIATVPKRTSKPKVVPVPQEHQAPHLPPRVPMLPPASSEMSPSLNCMEDRLVATLPSAKMNSIKVKDVKRKVWVPVTAAPARCGYSLQRKGRGVLFSAPLPTCHSQTLSPSLFSLSLKFWDVVQLRHRVLQLRCPSSGSQKPATTESFAPWTWDTASIVPKPKPSFSNASKPVSPPFQSQKPITQPLHRPKPTKVSFHPSRRTTTTTSWPETAPRPSQSLAPQVLCHSQHMSVRLHSKAGTGLAVQTPSSGTEGNIKAEPLDKAPSHCGYLMNEDQHGFINVLLPYASCHMTYQDGQYQIMLKYRSADGRGVEALLSCQVPTDHECNLPVELQLVCGPSSISAVACHDLGCCYSSDTATCYYPMDECTDDHHFVFSIPASFTDPPLSPALLVAAGNSSCTPQRVVADSALFKIPLDGCGAHRYEVGKTVIYMLEILNTVQSLSLNYGTITRESPFRLLVECRYLPGTMASVSYLVKSPSLGPSIQAQGVFGVQLRIAKDEHYSSYYPQYHRPLRKLLGKPLYLEVRLLNPPDPSVILLVHYCVAYPRSAQSAWVLIYDGYSRTTCYPDALWKLDCGTSEVCPNPLDVTPTHKPPATPPEAVANHARRFTVSTFQFLESNKGHSEPGEEEEEKEEEE
ncbi:hypothetical protein NFI96_034495, partial [Prochilodus magdalenae]